MEPETIVTEEKEVTEITPPLSTSERARDVLFSILDHPFFFAFGIFVLILVIVDGAFFFFLMVGWHGMCTPRSKCDPRNWWLNWSIQVLCGLFTYTSVVSMPWRVSNFLHATGMSCPFRSNDAGRDLSGLPTDDIWFHIPAKQRTNISLVLMFNCIFQYANQVTRFIYTDFDSTEAIPGQIWTLLFFILSMVFAGVGAYMTAKAEDKLRKEHPGKFTPGILEILKAKIKGDKPEKETKADDKKGGDDDVEVIPTPASSQSVKTSQLSTSVVMRNELRLFAL